MSRKFWEQQGAGGGEGVGVLCRRRQCLVKGREAMESSEKGVSASLSATEGVPAREEQKERERHHPSSNFDQNKCLLAKGRETATLAVIDSWTSLTTCTGHGVRSLPVHGHQQRDLRRWYGHRGSYQRDGLQSHEAK